MRKLFKAKRYHITAVVAAIVLVGITGLFISKQASGTSLPAHYESSHHDSHNPSHHGGSTVPSNHEVEADAVEVSHHGDAGLPSHSDGDVQNHSDVHVVPATTHQGIEGVAVIGPGPGACATDTNCIYPYTGEIIVEDSNGVEVLRFTPHTDGSFKVDLPEGKYLLTAALTSCGGVSDDCANLLRSSNGYFADVVANHYTEINPYFDSGMRVAQ